MASCTSASERTPVEKIARLSVLRVLVLDIAAELKAMMPAELTLSTEALATGLATTGTISEIEGAGPWVTPINNADQLYTDLVELQDSLARGEVLVMA